MFNADYLAKSNLTLHVISKGIFLFTEQRRLIGSASVWHWTLLSDHVSAIRAELHETQIFLQITEVQFVQSEILTSFLVKTVENKGCIFT